MPPRILVYADGSGSERTVGPGGWAFAVVCGEELLAEGWGREDATTCLSMEFHAAREGLEAVHRGGFLAGGVAVELVSDCRIALEAAMGVFLPRPARRRAEALALCQAREALGATARWVRAHAGDAWNEAVDTLARSARLGEAP